MVSARIRRPGWFQDILDQVNNNNNNNNSSPIAFTSHRNTLITI